MVFVLGGVTKHVRGLGRAWENVCKIKGILGSKIEVV
jgi:hypothetical protein